MSISLGLVGLGAFGSAFADLFKRHPLVSRVGLCDAEPERIRKFADRADWRDKFHPRDAYDSLDAICASDLDALVIITQHWLHAPQCLQALASGKHAYSAVPLLCVPDSLEILDYCDKLVNAVQRTGQHYMYGETTCYHPESMYLRRRVAEFGHFTYAEGEYFHAFDSPGCDLRQVLAHRLNSAKGREYIAVRQSYIDRGIWNGPMHYPTHSTGGPLWVMNTRATKVCCWGNQPHSTDPYWTEHGDAFSNETALYKLANGATMRICEHREVGGVSREAYRIYGTGASYEFGQWRTHGGTEKPTVEEMRDPLPPAVADAWRDTSTQSVAYGGHGGSHAYLVHEFVDAIAHDRTPAVNVWHAARFTAAGAMAHQSALRDGEILDVPDWGDPPTA